MATFSHSMAEIQMPLSFHCETWSSRTMGRQILQLAKRCQGENETWEQNGAWWNQSATLKVSWGSLMAVGHGARSANACLLSENIRNCREKCDPNLTSDIFDYILSLPGRFFWSKSMILPCHAISHLTQLATWEKNLPGWPSGKHDKALEPPTKMRKFQVIEISQSIPFSEEIPE